MENCLILSVAHMRESSVWMEILPIEERTAFCERVISLSVA
jgi:hypothetical protein